MFKAAVERPKRDQSGVLGIGERDARLSNALEPGGGSIALEDRNGIEAGEISTAGQERRFISAGAEHKGGRQQGGKLGQGNRGKRPAPGHQRLGAEPWWLRPERIPRPVPGQRGSIRYRLGWRRSRRS